MGPLAIKMQAFFADLRGGGIPVTSSQAEECLRSLLLVDWSKEVVFYSALFCTLVKEYSYKPVFDEIFQKHFHPFARLKPEKKNQELENMFQGLMVQGGQGGEEGLAESNNSQDSRGSLNLRSKAPASGRKDPFVQDFYSATYEDIKRMETFFPLLARRLASKMVTKKRKQMKGYLDYQRTLRHSMASGGVPIDLFVKKRVREKPIIFAICDVSTSCLEFSSFSLALVCSLEHFFRQVRGFAFIGKTDEITSILRSGSHLLLRNRVLQEADVVGATGYTNYGNSLKTFLEFFGKDLTHKSHVLIFGDARTNWYPSEAWILKEIQERAKRVYWFNPEPKADWNTGDSSMKEYLKYCDRAFECTNLEQLADAICSL